MCVCCQLYQGTFSAIATTSSCISKHHTCAQQWATTYSMPNATIDTCTNIYHRESLATTKRATTAATLPLAQTDSGKCAD